MDPISGVLNFVSGAVTNRNNRRFSREQYNLQRKHALEDRSWYEDYNSPVSQMARLKAAGLNPNLIYGSSPSGAAGGTEMPSKASANSVVSAPPQFGSVLRGIYDLELMDRQMNLLETQNTIAYEEANLKREEARGIRIRTDRDAFNLGYAKKMEGTSVETDKARLDNLRAETQYRLSQNEREALMNASNLSEAAVRILEIRERTTRSKAEREKIKEALNNIRWDTRVKQLDAEFRELGLGPQDGIVQRILGRLLQRAVDGYTEGKFKFPNRSPKKDAPFQLIPRN